METGPLRVVLRMEISLLSSAMAQVLASDPRLMVEVRPPGDTLDAWDELVSRRTVRTVEVRVLEDPSRIELHADGHDWVLEYRGLDCLAMLLADCQCLDTGLAIGAHGG